MWVSGARTLERRQYDYDESLSDNRKLDGGINAVTFDEISKYMINYNKVRR